jgi:hypothetical protein
MQLAEFERRGDRSYSLFVARVADSAGAKEFELSIADLATEKAKDDSPGKHEFEGARSSPRTDARAFSSACGGLCLRIPQTCAGGTLGSMSNRLTDDGGSHEPAKQDSLLDRDWT